MNCPNCGNEIRDEKAVYCPYCSKLLREALRKTGFPIVAGILAIVVACIFSPFAVLSMVGHLLFAMMGGIRGDVEAVAMILFGFLGFAFGSASGILSLKRRHFAVSITGLSLEILGGFVIIFVTAARSLRYHQVFADSFFLGAAIVIMAILSLIFVAISKKEFS